MLDKNNNWLQIGDMIRFKEDRYNEALGIIEEITNSGNLFVMVCGGGGTGQRLVSPKKSAKVVYPK